MRPAEIDTIRDALHCIPPSMPRPDWVRIGMALKSELEDSVAFELFDKWSAGADSYDEKNIRATWRTLKANGGTSIATLFGQAQANGWEFPKQEDDTQTAKPSAEEMAAKARAKREAAEREEQERIDRQKAAAAEAGRLWDQADTQGHSPYLERKGVKPFDCRFLGQVLVVPLRDAAGVFWSVQRIMPTKPADGGPDKLLTKGGRKSGLMHWCGSPDGAPVLLVAEGYATAASLHQATGIPCAMAIDSGNLPVVAKALRGRFHQARIFICGDDDKATEERTGRNSGREGASKAAALVKTAPVFPVGLEAGESDFNDLHARAGIEEVAAIVRQAVEDDQHGRQANRAKEHRGPASGQAGSAQGSAHHDAVGAVDSSPTYSDGDTGRHVQKDSFKLGDDGVWRYVPPGKDGGDGGWRWVCDPLHVEALARDATDGCTSLVVSFRSLFQQKRRVILALSDLAGDGGTWRGMLAGAGFAVPPDTHRRRWLHEFLASRRPTQFARLTERTGWHGHAYVLPMETLCADADAEPVLFVGERVSEGGISIRGDADRWRELIGRHCPGQSRLMFAVSAAFAGPLLAWVGGLDSGGFHLVGDSSCGKTTVARVASSVYGGPGFMQRWRGTDNGIEAIASAHSDLFLALDELAQLDPKMAGEAAYMLGNGAGKVRAGRTGGSRPRLSWRLLFLSAGEVGLSTHMADAGKKSRAGQELRLVDIPADAGKGFGAFDAAGVFEGSRELSQHLGNACGKAFGAVGREWLEHLAQRTGTLSESLRPFMDSFIARALPEAASGQVGRVARRFALVAAGGELATQEGFTGWKPGQPIDAAVRLFNDWIGSRPAGIGDSETTAMLRQVRAWFGAHGEARFANLNRTEADHAPRTIQRAGWRHHIDVDTKNDAGELIVSQVLEWLVLPDVFREEIAKGWSESAMLRLLDSAGHLRREGGRRGFTSGVRIPELGRKAQVIRIKSSLLEGGDG